MPAATRSSSMDTTSYEELEALMREFPDWKEDHPEVYEELHPQRYLKNKSNQPKQENIRVKKRASTVPAISDYQATYYKKHGIRPRSTKRPPPTPRDTNPPPMTLQSSMRAEFPSKFNDFQGRPPLMKHEDSYEPPTEKFQSVSGYQLDYPYKQPLPHIKQDKEPGSSMKRAPGKFESQTTNKEYYRQWAPNPALTFKELPCFTDSVLYPDQKRQLTTTTSSTFKGVLGTKPDPVRIGSPNIKLEGNQDFTTITGQTYRKYDNARKASPVIHKPELKVLKRSKFDHATQSMSDFGTTYKHGRPRPARPCTPPKASVDLKFDNKVSFSTEQRQQYPGHDVERHPVPGSYKPDAAEYRPPSGKLDTLTKHQMDYQPIDVTAAYIPPAKPPQSRKERDLPKFASATTSKEYFRKWEVQPRPHYGDVHEALQYARRDQYVPRTEKFDGTTTTGDQYKAKKADIPAPFVPEHTEFDKSGDIDLNTVYRTTFNNKSVLKNLPKSVVAQLLKDLRNRKAGKLVNGVPTQQTIFAK